MKKNQLLIAGLVATLALNLGFGSPTNLEVQFGSISGKVTGTDGKPAQNMAVRVLRGGAQSGSLPNDPIGRSQFGPGDVVQFGRGESVVATAKTDANGMFKVPKIQTGTYRIAVVAARAKPASTSANVEAGKDASVEIKLEAK